MPLDLHLRKELRNSSLRTATNKSNLTEGERGIENFMIYEPIYKYLLVAFSPRHLQSLRTKPKVLTKVHSPSFNPFVYPFIIIVITHEGAKMLVREVKEACLYTLNVYIFIVDKVAVCVYLRRVRLLPPS